MRGWQIVPRKTWVLLYFGLSFDFSRLSFLMSLKVSFSCYFFVSRFLRRVSEFWKFPFFKSQVLLDSMRAQVVEEMQGVATGVHGTHVRT